MIVEHYYAIQQLVPAKHSLSGEDYWHNIKLPDGTLQTPNLEYARDCYQIAQKNMKVRLVTVHTSILSDAPTPSAPIQVNWQAATSLTSRRAGKKGRIGFNFGENKHGLNLPLTDTAIQWLETIATIANVNRNDVLELWARGLMNFPNIPN